MGEKQSYGIFLNKVVIVEYGDIKPDGTYPYQKGFLIDIHSDGIVLKVNEKTYKIPEREIKKVRED